MKTYNVSCCGECPACARHGGKMSCMTAGRIIGTTDDGVNPGLVGIPSWCPLEDARADGKRADYRKAVRRVARILESGGYGEDAIAEAAHYLDLAVGGAKTA